MSIAAIPGSGTSWSLMSGSFAELEKSLLIMGDLSKECYLTVSKGESGSSLVPSRLSKARRSSPISTSDIYIV